MRKFINRAMAICLTILCLTFAVAPNMAHATELVNEDSVVVLDSADNNDETVTEDEKAISDDVVDAADEGSAQIEITINDEETPLYAGDSKDSLYMIYVIVILAGATLVCIAVHLFQSKSGE